MENHLEVHIKTHKACSIVSINYYDIYCIKHLGYNVIKTDFFQIVYSGDRSIIFQGDLSSFF